MYLSALYVKDDANQSSVTRGDNSRAVFTIIDQNSSLLNALLLTRNRAFFEIGSSSILHNHYFSDEAVSFLLNLHSGEYLGMKSWCIYMQLEYESVWSTQYYL